MIFRGEQGIARFIAETEIFAENWEFDGFVHTAQNFWPWQRKTTTINIDEQTSADRQKLVDRIVKHTYNK